MKATAGGDTLKLTHSLIWLLIAVVAAAIFAGVTVAVTGSAQLGIDSAAFSAVRDVRSPALDTAAHVVTTLGLIAIVGPAVAVAALVLARQQHQQRWRAVALAGGAAVTWAAVWIVKGIVDRPRPTAPLTHTSGASYPSAHAANSVGWLALALAISTVIPTRWVRFAVIAAGAVIAVLVGLSRIYLRAHYASDVIGGESLAVTVYALAAGGGLAWRRRRSARA